MYDVDILWERVFAEDAARSLSELLQAGAQETLRRFSASAHAEISLTLTDDARIQALNRAYRGIDRPTDVLSFALTEQTEDEPDVIGGEDDSLGDIVISLERAAEQASAYGHSLEREVVYLAVHGVLHLLGFDHEAPADRDVMRGHEEEVMTSLALAREQVEPHDAG
ncbi:MAG: rRNA maturation RNase YbeY [Peptococcaceae bacterium]|jgi:probable rRNA maturation factor|nr:rRNA maturation RNase YbeY [Peptococcaceae bacterium]